MKININIRKSKTHRDSYDLLIDDTGWDKGLLREAVEESIRMYVESTIDILEGEKDL